MAQSEPAAEAAPQPEPEPQPQPEPVAKAAPAPAAADESLTEATLIEPRSGPEAEERAYEEAVVEGGAEATLSDVGGEPAEPAADPYAASQFDMVRHDEPEPQPAPAAVAATDWDAPPEVEPQDDEFSPFPAADEVEPRRRSPALRILAIVLIVAALAAAFWFLAPPEWKARVGLGGAGASPLALVTTHMDRQRLESGNELLTITGRVINPTSKDQPVPPLQAQLKTKTGQVVYTWTIAPPARTLPPGASASFNSAEVNVPPGGDELTITLGSPRA